MASDYQSMSADEFHKAEVAIRKEIAELQQQRYTRRLERPHELKTKKRELARMLTARRAAAASPTAEGTN